jgi:hypothetical protein
MLDLLAIISIIKSSSLSYFLASGLVMGMNQLNVVELINYLNHRLIQLLPKRSWLSLLIHFMHTLHFWNFCN